MEIFPEKLDWDSSFFGFNVGKVFIRSQQEWSCVSLNEIDFSLIYVWTDQQIPSLDLFYAERLTYERKVLSIEGQTNKNIRKGKRSDFLLPLVYQAGHKSRFHRDPKMPDRTMERMYSIWYDACLSSQDHELWCYEEEGIKGMIGLQWKDDHCYLVLMATDQRHRAEGIGTALMNFIFYSCNEKGIDKVSLVTQGANTIARSFYTKKGFTLVSKPLVYHYWKD